MLNALLRFLGRRPDRLTPSPTAVVSGMEKPDGPRGPGIEYDLDAAALERLFLEWAFDLPAPGATYDAAAAEAAFAHLQMVAHRFDVRRMPRLPALVPQLLAAMRRDDNEAGRIAGLLARDPTLAGDVMRVAGSAHFARTVAPTSLRQAVQVLGDEGLRHVVLGSVMRPILRGEAGQPGYDMAARLWAQAEARTWLCGRLAAGVVDASEAQLAGIVAGTGIAALSRIVHPHLLVDAAAHPDFPARFLAIARPLSVRAGSHWQLPPTVLDAMQADADSPLARMLMAADRHAMGYRLVEAAYLPGDMTWPSGIESTDAPDRRAALFLAMAHEVEPLDHEVAAA